MPGFTGSGVGTGSRSETSAGSGSFLGFTDAVNHGFRDRNASRFISRVKEQKGNWLSDLKRLKGNISFVQYLEPANSEGMIHYYNDSIKNKDAELLKTRDPATRIRLRSELDSARYQLNQVLTNRSNFMYLYTYIFIQATSLEDLKTLEDNVQRIFTKLRMKALNPHYAHPWLSGRLYL